MILQGARYAHFEIEALSLYDYLVRMLDWQIKGGESSNWSL